MLGVITRFIIAVLIWANMPKAYASSCVDLMSGFLKADQVQTSTVNSFDSWAMKEASQLELKEETLKALEKKLASLEKKPSKKEFTSFLHFLDIVRDKNRLKFVEELSEISNPEYSSTLMKKHRKIQKLIAKEESRESKKIAQKIVEENPGLSSKEVKVKVSKEMDAYMKKYERLAYGCRSTKWTPERKAAGNTFKKFTIGIGLASSIGAYTYQNYDRDIDAKWIGRLGYELTAGVLVGLVASKIVSNPENSPVALALKKYFFSRGTGLVDMFAYGSLFGISNEQAQERLDNLMKDPNRRAEIEKLRQYMDQKNLYQKFKESFIEKVKNFKQSGVGVENKGDGMITEPVSGNSINWDSMTEEDLEDDEIQNLLMTSIISQMYDEQKGDLIATGNVGSDRFAFHAAYGALLLPKDTFVSLYIYNTLCMGAMNPKAALIKAIGIFSLNRIIFDQIYYFSRRTSINQ
ncbi:MAG: hypothetical protein ACJAT2_002706 [Bacteriovoracaceae bacterium]|jgi:hypothetical protein